MTTDETGDKLLFFWGVGGGGGCHHHFHPSMRHGKLLNVLPSNLWLIMLMLMELVVVVTGRNRTHG